MAIGGFYLYLIDLCNTRKAGWPREPNEGADRLHIVGFESIDEDRQHTVSGHSMLPALPLRALTDQELLARLEMLVGQERESTVDIVEHLIEVDRRESAIDLAYPSLFIYCVRKLRYSESAAFARIRAARAASEFPEVLQRLRSGEVHLDSIVRLYPYLEKENSQQLLDRAAGASKRDVLAIVAQLQTEPTPERDVVVPVKAGPKPMPPSPDIKTPELIPPPQHRFHFTADAELFNVVERLRGLLRHKFPDGRLEHIFKEAARALLERIERGKMPAPARSAKPKAAKVGSRFVPRSIKRLVWARDGGRCAYTAADGRRCESREALEYDHVVPWADGGRSDTPDNVRLLCRVHNQRLGRRRFGPRRRP